MLKVFHGQGPLRWARTIPIADVAEFRYDAQATKEAERVVARLKSGGARWVSGYLSGRDESKWLASELARRIGAGRDLP